ncbi:MAG: hypothetical protein M3Q07_12470 [Pseudobdellovibrionaceae bacterium]|nr:hypothetical protein [Pseudobdellovibrionaceae bacterium]
MLKSLLLISATLFSMTSACQKKDKNAPPFAVTNGQLKGLWIEVPLFENIPETLVRRTALKFDDGLVETFRKTDATLDCTQARKFAIENNTTIEIEPESNCPAAEFQVVSLDKDNLDIRSNNITHKLRRPNDVELQYLVSNSVASEAELSPGFKPFFVPAHSSEDVKLKFAETKNRWQNLSFSIKKPDTTTSYAKLSSRSLGAEKYCEALITYHDNEVPAEKLDIAVEEVLIEFSSDQDNVWIARNSLDPSFVKMAHMAGFSPEIIAKALEDLRNGIFSSQSVRTNKLQLKSLDSGKTIVCYRSLKDDIWTLEEAQAEIQRMSGGTVSIENR